MHRPARERLAAHELPVDPRPVPGQRVALVPAPLLGPQPGSARGRSGARSSGRISQCQCGGPASDRRRSDGLQPRLRGSSRTGTTPPRLRRAAVLQATPRGWPAAAARRLSAPPRVRAATGWLLAPSRAGAYRRSPPGCAARAWPGRTGSICGEEPAGVGLRRLGDLLGRARAITRPPSSPPSGPRSMIRSETLITSRLCSITTIELPASTSRWSTSSSRWMSAKCRPVVGSSRM